MPKTYDKFAPQYDAVMRPLERWFLTRLRTQTFNLLPRSARVLELGAGTGRNFVFYPDETSGVASEPSREMLKIAKDRERPAAVTLVQSRAEELPFKSAVFDAAFATLVFCSVSSPAKTFAELRRVVRSGGTILLLEHVRPGGVLGPVFDLISLATVPLFEDHFNRRTADDALTAGLQVLRVEKSLMGAINLISCRV
ncbi:MAG: class I SAM-dependent methyltransferase [Pyrinomonadaceae bacterium]|nr:class I SAM-dependent methyltransferase [Pyrinomonadaceae bacterium]